MTLQTEMVAPPLLVHTLSMIPALLVGFHWQPTGQVGQRTHTELCDCVKALPMFTPNQTVDLSS